MRNPCHNLRGGSRVDAGAHPLRQPAASPALQVMFSTGPMFLTVQYSLFPKRDDVAIINKRVYGKYEVRRLKSFRRAFGSDYCC